MSEMCRSLKEDISTFKGRRIAGSPIQWFGLKTSNVVIEYVPLFLAQRKVEDRLERI